MPSRETCERLKAAGFPQDDTYFYWDKTDLNEYGVYAFWSTYNRVGAAPTVGELMEVLVKAGYSPSVGAVGELGYGASSTASKAGTVPVFVTSMQVYPTAAEAAALLWLKVKGEK